MSRKVLVIGGTGVMGSYLVPELLHMGYTVDAVTLDRPESCHPRLRYFSGNAFDTAYLSQILQNGYDAIVDFMIYGTQSFRERYRLFLDNTEQYIYLSSYRVYADAKAPLVETSPRLLDVSRDARYLSSDDYSLHKARGEDALIASGKTNWTVVRPAITYSAQRMQLVTLEGNTVINRARCGKPVVLPAQALQAQTTMTYGADVAGMIARLVLNRAAYGEIYTVATAEHQSWETVAGYYRELIGLRYIAVPLEEFLSIRSDEEEDPYRWKLIYDRVYDRVIDNRKILNITGLKQSELTPLYQGLKHCIEALDPHAVFGNMAYSDRMDAYLNAHSSK